MEDAPPPSDIEGGRSVCRRRGVDAAGLVQHQRQVECSGDSTSICLDFDEIDPRIRADGFEVEPGRVTWFHSAGYARRERERAAVLRIRKALRAPLHDAEVDRVREALVTPRLSKEVGGLTAVDRLAAVWSDEDFVLARHAAGVTESRCDDRCAGSHAVFDDQHRITTDEVVTLRILDVLADLE